MKTVITLFMSMLAAVNAYGQGASYNFPTGTTWTQSVARLDGTNEDLYRAVWMCNVKSNMMPAYDFDKKYYIDGDTLIDGERFSKLYLEEDWFGRKSTSYVCGLQESDRKVFRSSASGKTLLYDFSMMPGDSIVVRDDRVRQYLKATAADTVSLNGRHYRRLHMTEVLSAKTDGGYQVLDSAKFFWVEGIGSNLGIIHPYPNLDADNGYNQALLWCRHSDTDVFTLADFDAETSVISSRPAMKQFWRYIYFDDDSYLRNDYKDVNVELLYQADVVSRGKHIYDAIYAYKGKVGPILVSASPMPTKRALPDAHYLLGIREEGGRVYVNQEEYENFLTAYQGVETVDLPYPQTADGELVLYDYNKNVGECYSQLPGHDAILVEKVEFVETDHENPRRLLTLSNGLQLLEGVGCINAPGRFLCYLNPTGDATFSFLSLAVANKYTSDQVTLYEQTIDKALAGSKLTGIAVSHVEADAGTVVQPLFDLQGRRISSSLQSGRTLRPGIYIRNGRKFIQK